MKAIPTLVCIIVLHVYRLSDRDMCTTVRLQKIHFLHFSTFSHAFQSQKTLLSLCISILVNAECHKLTKDFKTKKCRTYRRLYLINRSLNFNTCTCKTV